MLTVVFICLRLIVLAIGQQLLVYYRLTLVITFEAVYSYFITLINVAITIIFIYKNGEVDCNLTSYIFFTHSTVVYLSFYLSFFPSFSYEAWVIYNFLSLCLAWVGGPGAVVLSLSGRVLRPSWYLMTCCFPPIPLDG